MASDRGESDPAGLRERLTSLVGLRRAEVGRALPMALAYALLLASMYMLKPARNALFLQRFGAEALPYALVTVALLGGLGAAWFGRYSRGARVERLIRWLFVFLAFNLVLFRVLLPEGAAPTVYAFYVWVNLYGLVTTSLTWLFANSLFDPREARHVFGFLGAGGIGGAIFGSVVTRQLTPIIGTLNLTLLSAAALVGAALLLGMCRPLPGLEKPVRQLESGGAIAALSSSKLLLFLVGLTACGAAVSAVVDVQFNDYVEHRFSTTDAKAEFFGTFFAVLNLFALLFQLFITPRILARAGVGSALFLLPAALLSSAAGILAAPGLLAGSVAKASDLGLRHSLHRSASEILFLPVPAHLKRRVKLLVDALVDNLGTGVGALIALVMLGMLELPASSLSFAVLAMGGFWVWAAWGARLAYVDEFRKNLLSRRLDPNQIALNISDAATVNGLLSVLEGENDRQVRYALELLADATSDEIVPSVEPLLSHGDAEVRAHAIDVLLGQPGSSSLPAVKPLLDDPDENVRIAAMHYVCRKSPGPGIKRLELYLHDPEVNTRAAALACLARRYAADARYLKPATIAWLFDKPAEQAQVIRRELARAVSALDRRELIPTLYEMRLDSSKQVIEAVIESAGKLCDPRFFDWLIGRLGDRTTRVAARDALARCGAAVLPALFAALSDNGVPLAVRVHIPRVLSRIGDQRTVDAVLERLLDGASTPESALIKALSKLKARFSQLRFETALIQRLLKTEAAAYALLARMQRSIPKGETRSGFWLLRRAIREKRVECLERLFRLLGLKHSARDIENAYLATISESRLARASALEFLDNVLSREDKELILPLLDAEPQPDKRIPTARAVEGLLQGPDAWLRACALFVVDLRASPETLELVRAAAHDRHPVVSETARRVLEVTR